MSARNVDRPAAREPSGALDQALIDHGDQLRALLDNVPALILTIDLDGRIVFVNRPHLGIGGEQIVGHSLFEYPATAEEQHAVRDAFTRAAHTGTAVDYLVSIKWPTGTVRWFACRFGPILHQGRVTALMLIATDVTERREVERGLQESEERFRRIAEQSPDIIFRLGKNGLEYISPALATILGRRPDERLLDAAMSPQHIHPDDLARLPDFISQLEHGPIRYEIRMQHVDGHTVWTEHHLVPILSPSGKRIAVEGIVRDISERKRAEEALQRIHRELEERVVQRTAELGQANVALRAEIAERMRAQDQRRQHQAALAHVLRVSTMGEMAAGLAHEINQPLGAIANYANGIAMRLRAGPIQPEALLGAAEQIAGEALRAGEVIRRLRDFVRRGDATRERRDLNGLIGEAAHLIEPDARGAGIALRLVLAPNLPAVEIDPIQVEQVVLNLLRNGLEAMAGERTGGELLVETALGPDDTVEVRVRDSGTGVPPNVAERIFDAFFTTKNSGLGMGLSISRSIIEDHSGRLWMRPNHDRGATFGFSLRLPPVTARAASPNG
jgi:two-component system sensor histidine kinase TtrS